VIVGVFGPRRIRIVTHRDVGPTDADALCAAMEQALATA
jgi:hypothetical protein